MFDVAAPLMQALQKAQEALTSAAVRTSKSQTPFGDTRTDAAMASAAQRAIFAEALLGAAHARLSEIKSVTHG